MKYYVVLILVFVFSQVFALNKKDVKNNRKVINLFENQKVNHSFSGTTLAKSQLDDSGRPLDEGEIEVESNVTPPYRIINLREVQKSVFEENNPKNLDSKSKPE